MGCFLQYFDYRYRGTVKVERLEMKMNVGRLKWYGYVMRRDQKYVERRVMETELPGKRTRGRPKRRFLDVVKEHVKDVGTKETHIRNRALWKSWLLALFVKI